MRKFWFSNRLMIAIGLMFIVSLLSASMIFEFVIEQDRTPPEKLLFDENNQLIAIAPFPPSVQYPLGSDIDGNSFFLKIIDGAKYTIGLSLIIAFGRVSLSFLGGYLLFLMPSRFNKRINNLSDAFHYTPTTILTYVLIAPVVLTFSWSYDLTTKIIYPVIILILVSAPVLSMYVRNELNLIYKKDYVITSKLMGANHFHLYRRHVSPFLKPKLLLMFVQQVGQALIIFAHLGLLNIFIGGTETRLMDFDIETGEPIYRHFSMSNEWSGLISQNFEYAIPFPWMILAPVTAFASAILAVNSIAYGLKGPFEHYQSKTKTTIMKETASPVTKDKFQMIKKISS
ncbi:ABC transporter permease subunit [Halobacillus yeomjeoni]|uniref:ABC transporter permease subunit n=1 Tax=Halobacillus yeomjeoni TaxID=311194 RepID=A0A931MUG2_9BACI|nr:ABC transporter permease subunit [Halobacillus yeomjeoni]MBH0229692.1 ABC transporter permease subunit [Halobacillus yeomjeoni]